MEEELLSDRQPTGLDSVLDTEYAACDLYGLLYAAAAYSEFKENNEAKKRLRVIKEAIALIDYYRELSSEKLRNDISLEEKIYEDKKNTVDKLRQQAADVNEAREMIYADYLAVSRSLKWALFGKRKRLKKEKSTLYDGMRCYASRYSDLDKRLREQQRYFEASEGRLLALRDLLDFDSEETKRTEITLECRLPRIKDAEDAMERLMKPEVFRLLIKDKVALYSVLANGESRKAVCSSDTLLALLDEDHLAFDSVTGVITFWVYSTPELYSLVSLTDRVIGSLELRPPIKVNFASYPQKRGGAPELLSWTVVKKKKDKVLFVCDHAIDARQYNGNAREGLSWENSELREWMNGELLNSLFSKREQACLVPVERTEGGGSGSDLLFLPTATDLKIYGYEPKATLFASHAYMAEADKIWLMSDAQINCAQNDPQRELKASFTALSLKTGAQISEFCDKACLVLPAVWVRINSEEE